MNDTNNSPLPQRNYKDTVFRLLFQDRENLLSLFNAVNGTSYRKPEELEIITLQNAVYLSMKNDLSFLLDFQMYLYEHQSTSGPNLPLRNLFYAARQYEKLSLEKDLYGSRRIKLPTPPFIVFYNGTGSQPESGKLRLSDAYEVQEEEKELELSVTLLNINRGYNEALKEKCPALREYAEYVERVREYTKKHSLNEAVELAVNECIKEGILRNFLLENRAEVVSMSIFEYDQEEYMKIVKRDAYSEGWEDGEAEGAALKTISLVRNWIKQGLQNRQIADLTGESPEKAFRLIQILKENPETEDKSILKLWQEQP